MPMNNRLMVPRNTFTPRSIAGLAAWFDASDLSTLSQTSNGATPVTANNDPVAFWRCKITGEAVTQTTDANRPLYQAAGLGGKPAMDFDGTNDTLLTTTGTLLAVAKNVSGFTMICVSAADVLGATAAFLFSVNGSTSSRCAIGTVNSFDFRAYGRRTDVDGNAQALATLASPNAAGVFTGIFDYTNTDAFLRVNGSLAASNTSFQTTGSTSNTDSNRVVIGELFNGRIAEALAWPRVLSASELSLIERYLGRKYGVTVA